MKPSKETIHQVLQAQAGDRAALDGVFRMLQGPLYRHLRSVLGEPSLAEDVLQEVFVILYRKLKWLRDPAVLMPWAYRIASREALRRLKRERTRPDATTDAFELDAVAAQESQLDPAVRAELPRLVAATSPASRVVLSLHYFEQMPLAEIATVLDLSLGTVKSRLAYGLAVLRRRLEQGPTPTHRRGDTHGTPDE